MTHAVVKGWLDLLYANLSSTRRPTRWVPVHGLYIEHITRRSFISWATVEWHEMSGQAFCNFKGLNASYGIPAWTLPPNSPTWNKAVTAFNVENKPAHLRDRVQAGHGL